MMKFAAFAATAFVAWSGSALAQEWQPTEPIQIVVGFAPGGGSDVAARNIIAASQAEFPVPLVVENKPGAAGVLAAQLVAAERPDGYSLLVAGGSESTSVPAHREVPYDIETDFTPIIRLTNNPFFYIVRNQSPFQSIDDVIAAARETPGRITQANTGIGGLPHSVGLVLEHEADIDLKEVPYAGNAPVMQALLAGQVDLAMGATEEIQGQVEAGAIRVLASSGEERSSHYPDVPTLKELGYDVVVTNMKGLVGPAGMPPEMVSYYHDRFRAAMDNEVWTRFADRVGEPTNYQDAEGFGRSMVEQLERVRTAVSR